jgi:hypothetical protein
MSIRYLSGVNIDSGVLVVDSANDRVGIGTASPSVELAIYESSTPRVHLQNSTSGASSTDGFQIALSGVNGYLWNWENGATLFGTNNAERMRITSAGNVGIGTTSPVSPLDVNGIISSRNIYIAQNSGTYNLIYNASNSVAMYLGGSADQGNYYDNTTHYFRSAGGGATYAVINYLGNVGIGTTSPGTKLVIVGGDDAAGVGVLEIQTAGGTNLKIGGNSTYSWIQSHSSKPLYINQLGNNVILNSGGGNVGIGTTSPNVTLEANGKVRSTRSGVASQYLEIDGGTAGAVYLTAAGASKPLVIQNNNTTQSDIWFDQAVASNYLWLQAGTEKMRLNSSGNLGIGTTSPSVRLQVDNNTHNYIQVNSSVANVQTALNVTNSASTSRATLSWEDGTRGAYADLYSSTYLTFTTQSSEKMRITAAGTVAIGNAGSGGGYGIEINNSASTPRIDLVDNSNYTAQLKSNGLVVTLQNNSNNALVLGTNGTERVRVTAAGNVGIGTTAPAELLELSASANPKIRFVDVGNLDSKIGIVDSTALGFEVNGSERMRISSAGALKLNAYGSGSNTGTATQRLAVDASGNVIEIPIGSGPVDGNGTANYITRWSDADTITNSIIYDNGTNVGIGTATPSSKLDVVGAIISTGTYQARMIGAAGGAYFGSMSAVPVIFQVNQNEVARFDASGNLGIGTTSPAKKVTIAADSSTWAGAPQVAFYDTVSGQTDSRNWTVGAISTNYGNFTIANSTAAGGDPTTPRLTINKDGNVGIGTTSPAQKLDVNGAIAVSGTTFVDSTRRNIYLDSFSAGGGAGIFFRDGFTYNASITAEDHSGSAADGICISGGDGISFSTGSNSKNERMRITGAGNVGIGTTSPAVSLQVNASTAAIRLEETSASAKRLEFSIDSSAVAKISANQSAQSIAFETVGSERMRITDAGNVGIGTTTPSSGFGGTIANVKLALRNGTVGANGGTSVILIGGDNNHYSSITAEHTGGGDTYLSFGTSTGAVNPSEKMRITSGGNVGIGTTSPGYKLSVLTTGTGGFSLNTYNSTVGGPQIDLYDSTRSQETVISSTDGTTVGTYLASYTNHPLLFGTYAASTPTARMAILPSGNVGIGTTGPDEKLHVDGSTLITYNNSFQSTNSVGNKAILARVSPTSGIINYAEYATAANLNGFVIGSDDARVKGNITGDSLEFITNTSTRMTVLSSGNVGINTTTPGSTLHVVGDVLIQTGALGVGVNPDPTDGRIDASNDIVAFNSSDRRLKENITPIANALEKVRSLTGVEFDWKEETKKAHGHSGRDTGVIAQEVQAIMPTAVRTNNTGYLAVRYEKLIGLLIEGMKEQQAQIDELKAQINDSSR